MNTLLKNNYERKIKKHYKNIDKAMIIPNIIFKPIKVISDG